MWTVADESGGATPNVPVVTLAGGGTFRPGPLLKGVEARLDRFGEREVGADHAEQDQEERDRQRREPEQVGNGRCAAGKEHDVIRANEDRP